MAREPLSAIVLTFNVAHKLRKCLKSLEFVDELVVVDSGSTDETVAIAQQYTEHVFRHTPYQNYAAQNTWALQQTTHNWTLICDSDEQVTQELRDEILRKLEKKPNAVAYHLPRKNSFMGKQIKHGGWGNDTVVRFFRKDRCEFIPRQVHPELKTNGNTGRLSGALLHEPYANLDEWMERFQRYARWGAENAEVKGQRAGWITLGLKPLAKFFKVYVLRAGFLDGLPGLMIAMFAAFSMFMRYMYLYEVQEGLASPHETTAPPDEDLPLG